MKYDLIVLGLSQIYTYSNIWSFSSSYQESEILVTSLE